MTGPSQANRRVVRRLVLVALGMFGFGFALWPLYNVFCDLTGLGGRSIKIAPDAANARISDREIQIRFLATTNSALPWIFQPTEKTRTVQLGELSTTTFIAMNPSDKPLLGHATYNVVPPEASLYFVKTECFCFTQQLLLAQESREMPVYYYLQDDLPEHIREVTLAYTFYPVNDARALSAALASTGNQD
jgi:cytochrome c oxidase assembly protein subunit 11